MQTLAAKKPRKANDMAVAKAQVKETYTIRCVRCPNSDVWTDCNSADEAMQKTVAGGWEECEDGIICFECVHYETQKRKIT